MRLRTSRRFRQDLRRARRRQRDLDKLWAVVERLLAGQPLPPHCRSHRLSGRWSRSWECHIEPDWLLIWHVDGDALVLTHTGSHADLFR